MSKPGVAGAFWRRVLRGAFKPVDWFEKAESFAGFGLFVVLLYLTVGAERAADEMITSGLLAASTAMVFVAFVGLRLGRAAYHVHLEDMESVRAIEKQRDEAQTDAETLRLAASAKADSGDKAVIEALLPRLHYAVHELANRLPKHQRDRDGMAAWKAAMQKWEQDTKEIMESVGCTQLEISNFWNFTPTDLERYKGQAREDFVNRRRAWVQFRIDALRSIIQARSVAATGRS
jgi:hypothetical protein